MNRFSLVTMAKQLLEIKENFGFYVNDRVCTENYFTLHVFTQVWGSTTTAFGGIGGSAMTEQNTYVFVPKYDVNDDMALVFFGGQYGYSAYANDNNFIEDLKNKSLVSVEEHWERYCLI